MATYLASQRTRFTRNEDVKKQWIMIDAEGETLGRLAGRLAHRLRGKHRADYAPHQDIGDQIIVVNAGRMKTTGKKMEQKVYYKHSLYPGGLKTANLRARMNENPVFVLETAVKRMLPKGPLGRKLMRNIRIFADAEHPHKAQQAERWKPVFK
ncbi:MAG: 50S ribosomal protein L13 [Leptospirales bacterium]|nr:50S ribosomal protein L13 [Leptospirales bacterium]